MIGLLPQRLEAARVVVHFPGLWCAVLLTAAAVSGCGPEYDHEPVFPVSGSLFVASKPAVGAMVTFHPADKLDDPRAQRAFATVEDDGSFHMTTYFPADGVAPGEYVVTLSWPGKLPPAAHPTQVPPDRLRGRYFSPSKPYTRVTVEEKPNELEPFRISQ